MAQYWTDFSGYPTSQQPSDWTKRWHTDPTWTIVEDAGVTGGKHLRVTGTGSRAGLSWDEIGTVDDVELVVRWRVDDGGGSTGISGPLLRASGDDSAENGYRVTPFVFFSGRCEIQEYDDGSANDLGEFTPSWEVDEWWWIRARMSTDNVIKARMWEDGTEEPGTWGMEVDESGSPRGSGWAGLFALIDGSISDFDVFGAGTGGDSAPMNDPGGGGGDGNVKRRMMMGVG